MQALFLLAFAVGLAELAAGESGVEPAAGGDFEGVPLAALAVGSLYAYSFPGLTWLVGTLGVFAVAEVVRARSLGVIRSALVPTLIAVAAVAVAAAPEVPRMLDFASFETFDPDGAGLGNLFNPISPIEALGIWPSGDFRLDPGAGFAPAFAFYVGGVIGALALALGLVRALQAGETALASALVAGGGPLRVRARRGDSLPGGEGARDRGAGRDADRSARVPGGNAARPHLEKRAGPPVWPCPL